MMQQRRRFDSPLSRSRGRAVTIILLLFLTGIGMAIAPASAEEFDCGGAPCVFVYRGSLSITKVPGTWVKEVEVADLDGDLVPDLIAVVKQPIVNFNGDWIIQGQVNKDVVFNGTAGFNFDTVSIEEGFVLRPRFVVFPTVFNTVRGYDVEVVDLDRDGHLDIIRPDTAGILKVLWNDGDGVFSEVDDVFAVPSQDPNDGCPIIFGGGLDPDPPFSGGNYDSVSVADLDRDGDMDFVVGNWNNCGVNLLIENRWAQTGGGRAFLLAGSFPAKRTHTVSARRVNSDPYPDILLGHSPSPSGGGNPELRLATGPLTYGSPTSFPGLPNLPVTLAELVGEHETGNGFAEPQIPSPREPDINGDGFPDMVLGQGATQGQFRIYFHTGNDNTPFSNATTCSPPCEAGDDYDVRVGDFDRDRFTDLVTVDIGASDNDDGTSTITASDIRFFTVGANGSSFSETTDLFHTPPPSGNQHVGDIAVAAHDLDLDGDLDLVMGGALSESSNTAALHVYENRTLIGTQAVDLAVELSHVDNVATLRLENRGSGDFGSVAINVIWTEDVPLISPLAGNCVRIVATLIPGDRWFSCSFDNVLAGESVVVGNWQAMPVPAPPPSSPAGSLILSWVSQGSPDDTVEANDVDRMHVQGVTKK